MRTRVIPAQITTVEDKIAGNFSLTQIIILLTPVLFTTLVYALMPPTMMFVWYKLTLTLVFMAICIVLSIRVKGKIIASWIVILARFNLRPKYYVFDKNEVFARRILKPKLEKVPESKVVDAVEDSEVYIAPSIKDLLQLNHLIQNKGFGLSYKTGKKGGLHVAFEKVAK